MNRRKFILSFAGALFMLHSSGKNSWANKAEVKIELPEGAVKGTEIPVRVTVIHNANSYFHHVEWVWIKFNENEIGRWEFTASNRPEGETFTREIKYRPEGEGEIKAKASCNVHGSAGEVSVKIL
jgi:desulfoferrodoxin (superoxide reductase-like protein)